MDAEAPSEVMGPPAPRPCASCPYRCDVPSGVWDAAEYAKLAEYDAETGSQPQGLFQCHQNPGGGRRARMCSGWLGTHGGENLLAVRIAAVCGSITGETVAAAFNYASPVPLFPTGQAAADHGVREIDEPSPEAQKMIGKIVRARPDIR